jgi:hypothetical protein
MDNEEKDKVRNFPGLPLLQNEGKLRVKAIGLADPGLFM